jgi:two-component system, OmpR family, phosphate regulon response regulator PhoB
MSGREFLRRLRQSAQFYDLPVIMFTGVTGREDEEQARFMGAQEYIRKPFDPGYLLSTVRRLLERYSSRPQHRPLQRVLAGHVDTDREEQSYRVL